MTDNTLYTVSLVLNLFPPPDAAAANIDTDFLEFLSEYTLHPQDLRLSHNAVALCNVARRGASSTTDIFQLRNKPKIISLSMVSSYAFVCVCLWDDEGDLFYIYFCVQSQVQKGRKKDKRSRTREFVFCDECL